MHNKIETFLSMGTGGVLAAVRSYQYFDFFSEAGFRTLLAVFTGFFGALAGLFAKLLFNIIRDKYFPNHGGK